MVNKSVDMCDGVDGLSRLIRVVSQWEARAGRTGGVAAHRGGGASPVKPEARRAVNRKLSELAVSAAAPQSRAAGGSDAPSD